MDYKFQEDLMRFVSNNKKDIWRIFDKNLLDRKKFYIEFEKKFKEVDNRIKKFLFLSYEVIKSEDSSIEQKSKQLTKENKLEDKEHTTISIISKLYCLDKKLKMDDPAVKRFKELLSKHGSDPERAKKVKEILKKLRNS